MSAFITIEGIDGSGKSTQTSRLAQRLRRLASEVVVSREPGGSPLGEALRTLLLARDRPIDPRAEALLLAAARADHVQTLIRPALSRDAVVVVDRFVDSSLAYQGYGLGLGVEWVLQINRFALATTLPPSATGLATEQVAECWPDLTVLLDLPVVVAQERFRQEGRDPDRVEARGTAYLERVREGYLQLAERWPQRISTVPAEGDKHEVESAIWQAVLQRWPQWASLASGTEAEGGRPL